MFEPLDVVRRAWFPDSQLAQQAHIRANLQAVIAGLILVEHRSGGHNSGPGLDGDGVADAAEDIPLLLLIIRDSPLRDIKT